MGTINGNSAENNGAFVSNVGTALVTQSLIFAEAGVLAEIGAKGPGIAMPPKYAIPRINVYKIASETIGVAIYIPSEYKWPSQICIILTTAGGDAVSSVCFNPLTTAGPPFYAAFSPVDAGSYIVTVTSIYEGAPTTEVQMGITMP